MTMKPPHPGETLKQEYLIPLGMSVDALAKELGIGAARLKWPSGKPAEPSRRTVKPRQAT